ncbi:hypothetical protein [Streptodolium elevatio]|uniref:Uncharacterized protein n=1 Tax=Streptodolium elevatio TaxID=3157996 RepID=A0ABV3DJY9_9ACTN
MTDKPDDADKLGVYLHDRVDYDDHWGTCIATDVTVVAQYALDWLAAHPETASALWPDGVEIYVDGKWVSAASSEVVAKIRRLEGEARAAHAAADKRIADADQRIKDLQAEFARQRRVYESRIERAQAALHQPTQEQS